MRPAVGVGFLDHAFPLVSALVSVVACSAGGLQPRLDGALSGSGGTTTASAADAGPLGGTPTTGPSLGSGGATAIGGTSGSTTALGAGGVLADAHQADVAHPSDATYPVVDGPNGLGVIDPDYLRDHFNDLVAGTWLIGWYGGQNHFSWIRLTATLDGGMDGKLEVLAEPAIPTGVPYWACSGAGSWTVTERPQTLDLRMGTAGCGRQILAFDWFRPVGPPGKAFLEAEISAVWATDGGWGPSSGLTGLKFPDDVCNAPFTSCSAGF